MTRIEMAIRRGKETAAEAFPHEIMEDKTIFAAGLA